MPSHTQPPESVLGWLHNHPWGWLLLLGTLLGAFVLWLSAPLTWRNAEGSLIDEDESYLPVQLRRSSGWLRLCFRLFGNR